MSKRTLILLITLMSVSLIGVIIIQGFFIVEIYRDAERKFNNDSSIALSEGVEWLEKRGKSRALENLEEASAAIEKESLSNG